MEEVSKSSKRSDLNLEDYNTDKISNAYLDVYDEMLLPWVGKKVALLELGILNGGSLQLWSDYFPVSKIVGLDLHLPKDFQPKGDIHMFQGSQADTNFLSEVSDKTAPEGFDIIIDDASHVGELSKISFWHLFDNHLKPGGLYVVEDWGTGYWNDWPDGRGYKMKDASKKPSSFLDFFRKIRIGFFLYFPQYLARLFAYPFVVKIPSHDYGMVGFVKQLIDEQSANNITRKRIKGTSARQSKFKKMIVTPSIVFIYKAD